MANQPLSLQQRLARALALVATLFVLGVLLLQSPSLVSAAPRALSGTQGRLAQPLSSGHLRRVNIPYFPTTVSYNQAAIFWLGQVTPNTQYGDIRMGYNGNKLWISANVIDRLLWYNANWSNATNLGRFDSISVYLNMSGTDISAPNGNSFRFDTGFTWWESDRSRWQFAYQGNGSGWTKTSLPFVTRSGWRGDQPNNLRTDRGWSVTLNIPFTSLGLSGTPPKGTVWGLGIALHNRNDATGTPIADQVWPENMSTTDPTTWGLMRFGLAPGYTAPTVQNAQTTTIRNRLNGQAATTTNVGGYTICGTNLGNFGPIFYQQWGLTSWGSKPFLNVMNQSDVADWPCFNKIYANFPLSSIPSGKAILSAKLTLYQYGHAGAAGQYPGPSLIQAFSTDTDWTPSTINWNNAPWPNENLDRQWAGTGSCRNFINCPAVTWDVSQQVADAYSSGQPLRVILYDSDNQISSGKYFFSSDQEDWNAVNRPTLKVTFGNP